MRIAIVEDSDLVHAGLLGLVERCPRARVVGRAVSEATALQLVEDVAPDVVLLDLHLAPGSGLNVLRSLRRGGYGGIVLVVTGHDGETLRLRCIAEGADGYYDKQAEPERLLERLCLIAGMPAPASTPSAMPADTTAELAFDALAQRAADLTGCPMAAVSLAGSNRQWMIGRSGFDLRCVSRNVSLCAHVGDGLMEIPDTQVDPRFRLNPMLEAPFSIRFYAGAPIVLPNGAHVGVLCVWASEPGELDGPQREELARLAREAADQIERLQASALVEQARVAHDGASAQAGQGTDPLTGLPRRDALLHGPQPEGGEGMLCIGLDRFSRINHAFGREAADRLLVEVAQRLGGHASRGQVVRLAGDEFAIRVAGPMDALAFRALGESVASAISRPIDVAGRVVRLRASIGLALADAGDTCAELFGRADLAMRHAKQSGGNVCQLYALWMGRRAADRVEFEEGLRGAIAGRQLFLEFQPLLDLPRGDLLGVEALVRWQHPERGRVPPDAFIGIAEEIGLIRELGEQVLDLALAQLVAWDAEGIVVPRVSVNVSPLQLEPAFLDVVESALFRHGLDAARLEIEVTESALPRDEHAAALLEQLRQLGVALAVDDFGTGYSSLATLRRMPVSTLKIDRHFIEDLGEAAQDAAVVGAIVSMAHSLGMRATAEGVETDVQERCLRALGCDIVQGYRYSHPLPGGLFAEWFRRLSPRTHAGIAGGADTSSCQGAPVISGAIDPHV